MAILEKLSNPEEKIVGRGEARVNNGFWGATSQFMTVYESNIWFIVPTINTEMILKAK